MAKNQAVGAFEPDGATAQPDNQAQAAEVAPGSAMTVYGMTVDAIVEGARKQAVEMQTVIDGNIAALAAKEAKIAELVEYGKNKNAMLQELVTADAAKATLIAELGPKVESLTKDLGMARLAAQKRATIPQNLERLPGGGIRLAVELDVDESAPLLSWADSAGEDPATYIARQVKDALVAVTSS